MLNDLLENLPGSDFDDAMYQNERNSNIMSMSVPDSNYFDSFTSSNVRQKTDNYSYYGGMKQCYYKTKQIPYRTSYVGTTDSTLKVLGRGVPATSKVNPIDYCLSKSNVSLKNRKTSNCSSNFSDPSRGYDSEPNWCDRPFVEPIDVLSKSWNHHDDMTRKWFERGKNNSYRASLSLDLVKQSTWDEFDDADNSILSTRVKRRKNTEKHRQKEVVVPSKMGENSKNRIAKLTNKSDEEQKREVNKSNKELIECKTYFDTTITHENTDTKKVVSSIQTNEKSPKESIDSGSDDVFESPNRKRNPRFTKRRSSSLDALTSNLPFQSNQLANLNLNRSSVSIKDKPEYYEYPKSPMLSDKKFPSGSVANSASNFHNSLGTNPLTTPKRPSIKNSSTENTKHSSDYDVRDRGRGRNSNGRDPYRDRHGERDSDRGLSDREQRESYHRSSFNRSMSNTEGTPEDKIGEIFTFVRITVCVNLHKNNSLRL